MYFLVSGQNPTGQNPSGQNPTTCYGGLASLTNSIVLYWRGRARSLCQQDVCDWDVPTCTASPRSGWNQPAAGAATIPTRTVERR